MEKKVNCAVCGTEINVPHFVDELIVCAKCEAEYDEKLSKEDFCGDIPLSICGVDYMIRCFNIIGTPFYVAQLWEKDLKSITENISSTITFINNVKYSKVGEEFQMSVQPDRQDFAYRVIDKYLPIIHQMNHVEKERGEVCFYN